MKMSDPQRIACSNQLEDMTLLLQQKLTPTTQLVLLLAPRKDSRRVVLWCLAFVEAVLDTVLEMSKGSS